MTSLDKKERKRYLAKKFKLCAFCRYHRGENRSKRIPRSDRHKSHRQPRP